MPPITTIGPYRYFFSSSDGSEPSHIQVEFEGKVAKFWLSPVELSKTGRLADHQLRKIEKLIVQHQAEFIEAWNDYFSN